ncbi:phosphoglycerate dehydrogenase [Marivirga sp. S37H4]|uniref:Phosphoglycerate dehydrogenase n=1 Tax=Marivirga aurantiaca TaxID=2802615 RepID=A0A935C8L0_9BACT|nr:NAD(P)-dependent oxidoreductase [Marivirga aurantiaca]MBK6263758.1 phosphoglycerate dehydrogenase [Marivirga aurantiaca]
MNVLIIDKMHDSIHGLLKAIGVNADYQPDITREKILQIISSYEGLIVRSKTYIDAEVLSRGKNLKFVARAGAGIDNVDMEVMNARNITLLNAPEGNRDALAEHCIGILLALLNKIHVADQEVRNGKWDREGSRGVELMGKTIGLLGYGFMGEAFAKRLQSFGCEIIAYDKDKSGFGNEYVKEVSLSELKEKTQILSIHIPLIKENRALIDKSYLTSFKRLDYLVNTSRGEVLVLEDLLSLLQAQSLKGAALDVLENEKINSLSSHEQSVFEQLVQLPQTVLTPHVAGWSFESYQKINEILTFKIEKLVEKRTDF